MKIDMRVMRNFFDRNHLSKCIAHVAHPKILFTTTKFHFKMYQMRELAANLKFNLQFAQNL